MQNKAISCIAAVSFTEGVVLGSREEAACTAQRPLPQSCGCLAASKGLRQKANVKASSLPTADVEIDQLLSLSLSLSQLCTHQAEEHSKQQNSGLTLQRMVS